MDNIVLRFKTAHYSSMVIRGGQQNPSVMGGFSKTIPKAEPEPPWVSLSTTFIAAANFLI